MNTAPTSLKPDAAAWVQAQLAINHARVSADACCRVEAVEQWASGLFIALRDVLFHVLVSQPEMGRYLSGGWRYAAEQFDAIQAGVLAPTADANLDLLEARQLLYRAFTEQGLMPKA